ncbi:conjugative transposon protein TraM [Paraflavitalea sp. CAU 1676]|uniref:conjugative transposon protein TraM n=1 Tax=Paraflavitalea sp. CAU 1676 TaxID=3032598 RepID=UPI0023DC9BAF|nr:conjugative transposon protein TraM [Paraflavitalea sp. CAU 1676]MDF2188721.1 conjugative transposon protein TraM [Paraflavitalea sp. CAU 1676]
MEKTNKINHSQKFIRQRKFLLLLPLLALPFITFVAHSAGIIGKEKVVSGVEARGFNTRLPDAAPTADSNWNKLKFYEKADKDSAARRSMERSDPYRTGKDRHLAVLPDTGGPEVSRYKYDPYPGSSPSKSADANEQRVYKKLAELDRELNRQPVRQPIVSQPDPGIINPDVERLERMMASVGADNGNDEFSQINGMLEKILDVQHPDRVREKIKEKSVQQKSAVFPVTVEEGQPTISMLSGYKNYDSTHPNSRPVNRFYGLDETYDHEPSRRSIRAVIPEAQTLVNGATVKLMLLDDVYIGGSLIPRYTSIYGIASFGGERIRISITSLQHNTNLFPVVLMAYDLDGLEGIFVPGSITRDVSKQSADQAIQSLGIASLDPSLGAQAASAGLEAAKTILGRKTRLVRANIPGNYEVLLRDVKSNER